MFTFANKKYAKNDSEFIESLFQSGGTCNGYYKRVKNGVRLYDMQKNLEAFIVDNSRGERFVVSAGMRNGKPFYMFSTCSATEKWLGIDGLSMREVADSIEDALNPAIQSV